MLRRAAFPDSGAGSRDSGRNAIVTDGQPRDLAVSDLGFAILNGFPEAAIAFPSPRPAPDPRRRPSIEQTPARHLDKAAGLAQAVPTQPGTSPS